MRKKLREDELGMYIMATEAHHMTGDISSDEYDLALVFDEDENNLYGNWVFGFGFIDVRFPKNTVREITSDDISKYDGKMFAINNKPLYDMTFPKEHLWKDNKNGQS